MPFGPKTKARVVGVCKGAGMIAPNMATTLVFIMTDAAVSKGFLKKALAEEVQVFNEFSVDGDTSTNDSLFLMASGAAKNKPVEGGDKGTLFRQALRDVLIELGRQIVRDGEGATHVVTIEVLGAPDAEGVDMLSVIRQYNLSLHFPKRVLQEARSIGLAGASQKGTSTGYRAVKRKSRALAGAGTCDSVERGT